jgi:hypothetical protein
MQIGEWLWLVGVGESGSDAIIEALVHLRLEGKMPPDPGPLSASRLAPDGFGASGRQHPDQNRDANGRFGLLDHKTTGSQPRSDQRLVAAPSTAFPWNDSYHAAVSIL